ncbi:MAG: histidine phosphatase family protein [Microscillaceae bacterium]|nr:histidine phosphatase family protein [Microscillaceae bacterium]
MQRELLIIRHAKAEEIHIGQDDFDRSLKKRGVRDAETMGELLRDRQLAPDLICVSPAKRTSKTAEIIAKSFHYSKDSIIFERNIYDADLHTLLQVVNFLPDSAKRVYLVGHNPGLTMLADYLGDTSITFIPTCGIAYLGFDVESWGLISKGLGHLIWLETPKENI